MQPVIKDHPSSNPLARRVVPFRSYEEYTTTPGIEMATRFAEACNMCSHSWLYAMLHPDIQYISLWASVHLQGRMKVLQWFAACFRVWEHGDWYQAQVVVLPTGAAAVMVQTHLLGDTVLVIPTGRKGVARRILVAPRFNSKSLRLTGYFPPEA